QGSVAWWNLHRLAGSLMAVGPDAAMLKQVLEPYEKHFLQAYRQKMVAKFGLREWQTDDDALFDGWWRLLHDSQADFTQSFRALATAPENREGFVKLFSDHEAAQNWLDDYMARVAADALPTSERQQHMNAVNPLY